MSGSRTGRAGSARRDFAVDRANAYTNSLSGVDASWQEKLPYLLRNSEFHCVAAYRFGQYAKDLRSRHPLAGTVAVVGHWLWNRRLTHVDHADISRDARIGPGMLLTHRHGILIGQAVIGKNCVIHHNVTIGQRGAA